MTLHVHFAFNKYNLTKVAQDTLNIAVAYFQQHNDVRVEVQGHTDSKGTEQYNIGLGHRRANSVKDYLVSKGIAASRITTESFGKSRPVAENTINGKDNGKRRPTEPLVVTMPSENFSE